MEETKTKNIAEKVKAVAMTFIGAGIFSQGLFYFKEQSSYNIPRILYPIFELLGNKGLAISMPILGLVLIYFGYTKWKIAFGKSSVFALIALSSFALFLSILFLTGNKKVSAKELIKTSAQNSKKGIADMNAMDKPQFTDPAYNQHFIAFETLLQQYKDAYKNENEHAIAASQTAFTAWNKKSAVLMQKLSSVDQKQQFALYLGKLAIKWQQVK